MAKSISDELFTMLADADKRNGFPAGTMHSVLQQESGGNAKYIDAPDTYHYGLNADGKRIAGHTGKVSTAFGPFGILESTGADPGYGVKPLKDKSLGEQVRFASDYLAARSKHAGGLEAGLSGYGEGGKYGQQVMGRIGKGNTQVAQAAPVVTPVAAPVQLAQVPVAMDQAVAPQVPAAPVQLAQATPIDPRTLVDPNMAWQGMQQAMPQEPIQVASIDYTKMFPQQAMDVQGPRANIQPNFRAFGKWGGRA